MEDNDYTPARPSEDLEVELYNGYRFIEYERNGWIEIWKDGRGPIPAITILFSEQPVIYLAIQAIMMELDACETIVAEIQDKLATAEDNVKEISNHLDSYFRGERK